MFLQKFPNKVGFMHCIMSTCASRFMWWHASAQMKFEIRWFSIKNCYTNEYFYLFYNKDWSSYSLYVSCNKVAYPSDFFPDGGTQFKELTKLLNLNSPEIDSNYNFWRGPSENPKQYC
jgi:hypothetical protein